MDIRNILWGFDGTLFDTYPAIDYAISKSLGELGQALPLNVIDGLVRQSLDYCLETLSLRFNVDPDLLRLRVTDSYLMVPLANQPPFPGVSDVCGLIQQRGGLNVIATHQAVEYAQRLLAAHGLTHLFAGILNVKQGYPCKPVPAMLDAALRQFKLERIETLLIGNRDSDIQAGRAAGVRACLFGRAPVSHPPDIQIDHYSQLLSLLGAYI